VNRGRGLPDVTEDLAADILFPRFSIGHDAFRSRDDGDADPAENPGDIFGGGVNTQTWLTNPLESINQGLAIFAFVFEGEDEMGFNSLAHFLEVLDEAFFFEHPGDTPRDAGRGDLGCGMAYRAGVADTSQHIRDGIVSRHEFSVFLLAG
jgi:hypothetical protein